MKLLSDKISENNNMENNSVFTVKVIVAFIIGVIIGYAGTGFFIKGPVAKTAGDVATEKNKDELSGAALSAQNAILVRDQKAGINVEIEFVNLENTGWVVINESDNGIPGNALGAQLFDPGLSSGIVELLRGTEDGKIYHAMIRQDDGDRAFDLTKDFLLTDTDGNPVSAEFKAIKTVSEEE